MKGFDQTVNIILSVTRECTQTVVECNKYNLDFTLSAVTTCKLSGQDGVLLRLAFFLQSCDWRA